jgi:hypothetical protein
MNNIPPKLRKEIERDLYYRYCCITGMPATMVKIEWHHNFIYAGRQVQEKWCILPVDKELHKKLKGDMDLRGRLDWIMLNRATEEELNKYKRAGLFEKRERLNKKYGSSN